MSKYLIVIEKTENGFSAYSPDLPGCVSTGYTRPEVEANMKEAIEFHLDGMKEEGYTIRIIGAGYWRKGRGIYESENKVQ